MNEEINPADSLMDADVTDQSLADVAEVAPNDPQQENGQSNLLKFTKKISKTSKVFIDYNKVLDYIVKNYKNWDRNAQGCYILKRNKHVLSFDGKNIPQIDDKYFLSDVLIDKLPKSIENWIGGLK